MNPMPTQPPAATDKPAGGETELRVRKFQHYDILRRADGSPWELGRGTMGITYKALDTNLRSEVALKVVNSTLIDRPSARERFVREARAAAALRHRNVASVYHLGNDGEHFFYAMEFIDGETLDALVRRQGPLPVGTALRLTLQAARALAAAARQNLVHRDIKPANLMVVHEDADEHMVVKVIDFGLARPTATDDGDGGEAGAGSLTIHGFVGTPQYASPEQLEERVLDARSDIYSLGVTLWFLLTGKPPFTGSLAGICNQQISKPPPWESLPASVPDPVRKLLRHMLEKDAERRPQDAVELRREIDECLAVLHMPAPASAAEDGPSLEPAPGPLAKLFSGLGRGNAVVATPATVPMTAASPAAPEIGLILDRRFQLSRLVGEGRSGRVFEARDLGNGGRPAAVKLLRAGAGGRTPGDWELLRIDARQVSAAPHLHLVQLLGFELAAGAPGGAPAYVAEEWLSGFTLRDFLAARSGALPAVECLRLLAQAAEAADHATSRRLERLEMGIHQIHLHFPGTGQATPLPDYRALLQMSMEEWPKWSLKIEAFGLNRDDGESGTWGGDLTLLPGTPMTAAVGAAAVPVSYLHALARITCELLGGQPPATTGSDGRTFPAKYVSLPHLNEAGNAVLARALSDAPGFPSVQAFYEALATASGFNAGTLSPAVPLSLDPFPSAALPVAPPAPLSPSLPTDSSAAQTRLQAVGVTAGGVPAATARTSDPSPAVQAYETDVSGLEVPAPVRRRGKVPREDPWGDSKLAQMLEEEEARKLIDPRSTGFALGVGAMIGLVLLMAGFAVVAWRRQSMSPAAAQKHNHPASVVKSGVGSSRPATPGPARTVPLATPPPLVRKQPAPPAAQTLVAPPLSTPSAAQNFPDPGRASLAEHAPSTIIPADSPVIAASPSLPSAAASPPVVADSTPSVSQPLQPFLTPEETRQRADPTPRFRDKMVGVRLNSDPVGAEIFLDSASLGKTPLSISLPPGDYQFVARYKDWPEIRQDMHLSEQQGAVSADIRLMSPGRVPSSQRAETETENRRRHNHRERAATEEADSVLAAPPVASETVPVARAVPVEPPSGENSSTPMSRAARVRMRRAWPVLRLFGPRVKATPEPAAEAN